MSKSLSLDERTVHLRLKGFSHPIALTLGGLYPPLNAAPLRHHLLGFAKADRYLRLPEVLKLTGHAQSTLYRLMKHGHFPKSHAIGPNATAWKESEVIAWCKTRKPRNRVARQFTAGLVGGCDD